MAAGEMVLYFTPENKKEAAKLKGILVQMGVRIKMITQEQVQQKVGFLAGVEGFTEQPGAAADGAEEMDREIRAAMAGKPASMILKNNSLNDVEIIDKISQASCAGVQVDMIVRGICCMKAGLPGKTENVRIRSLVGRYLEHSRIYCFGQGEDMRVYIASADFLTRNTQRRVEVGVRIDDPRLKKMLYSILTLQLKDNVNAREMRPDGSYARVKREKDAPVVDSQMAMYDLFRDKWLPQEQWKPQPQPVQSKESVTPIVKKTVVKKRPAPKKNLFQKWVGHLVRGKK